MRDDLNADELGDGFDDSRLTAMGLLIEVHGGLTARLSPVFAQQGISGNDFDVLIRVARSPGGQLRMTDLAAQTGLSTSGITRVVDRLEREGLASRRPCPHDRRSSMAVLTDTGLKRLQAVVPGIVATIQRWYFEPLGPAQLDGFLAALRTLRGYVRPEATAGSD